MNFSLLSRTRLKKALNVFLVNPIDQYGIILLEVFDGKILFCVSKEGLELEEMRRETIQIRLVAIDERVIHLLIQDLQICLGPPWTHTPWRSPAHGDHKDRYMCAFFLWIPCH